MTLIQIVLASFIFAGIGCASYTNQNNNLNRIEMESMHSFATMNKQIWGEYGIVNEEYSEFTIEAYERILRKNTSDTASEATKFYDSLSAKEIYATKLSYVICGYSDKHNLAFCDDAACENIEQLTKAKSTKNIPTMKEKISNPGHCK